MTMNRIFSLVALAATLTISGTALAGGDIEAGKKKTAVCAACHGVDGNATDPQYPRLAGQYHDYLEQALREYKAGKRKNVIMGGFAKPLSEQDILDVSAYFASLPGKIEDLHGHLQGQ